MTRTALLRIALVTATVLSVPVLAMRLTDEVQWNVADFIVAGSLLIGAGVAFELLAPQHHGTRRRILVGVGVLAVLLLAWIVLAVGG